MSYNSYSGDKIKKHFGDIEKISQKLNIEKFENGCNGESWYIHMHKWFLSDTKEMVGSENGFTIHGDVIRLWLEGRKFIRFFTIDFSKHSGEYIGMDFIRANRWTKDYPKITNKQKKLLRTEEINQIILGFIASANRLEYLN